MTTYRIRVFKDPRQEQGATQRYAVEVVEVSMIGTEQEHDEILWCAGSYKHRDDADQAGRDWLWSEKTAYAS